MAYTIEHEVRQRHQHSWRVTHLFMLYLQLYKFVGRDCVELLCHLMIEIGNIMFVCRKRNFFCKKAKFTRQSGNQIIVCKKFFTFQ